MNKNKFSGEKKLAILALVLGFIALFTGDPKSNSIITDVDNNAIKVEKISVEELADWIINGKADFQLFDLREQNKYNDYFIPSAVNSDINGILNSEMPKDSKIIIYSDDSVSASKAYGILKVNGFNGAKVLEGGIESWKNKILFPTLKKDASEEEILAFKKISEVSKFFGGSPSDGGNNTKIVRKMPKISAPVQVNLNKSSGKKAREGC